MLQVCNLKGSNGIYICTGVFLHEPKCKKYFFMVTCVRIYLGRFECAIWGKFICMGVIIVQRWDLSMNYEKFCFKRLITILMGEVFELQENIFIHVIN